MRVFKTMEQTRRRASCKADMISDRGRLVGWLLAGRRADDPPYVLWVQLMLNCSGASQSRTRKKQLLVFPFSHPGKFCAVLIFCVLHQESKTLPVGSTPGTMRVLLTSHVESVLSSVVQVFICLTGHFISFVCLFC